MSNLILQEDLEGILVVEMNLGEGIFLEKMWGMVELIEIPAEIDIRKFYNVLYYQFL